MLYISCASAMFRYHCCGEGDTKSEVVNAVEWFGKAGIWYAKDSLPVVLKINKSTRVNKRVRLPLLQRSDELSPVLKPLLTQPTSIRQGYLSNTFK